MREGRLPGPGAARDPVRAPPSASIPRWSAWPPRRCAAPASQVASVATGFPAGQTSLDVKVDETREAVAAGATEIDMVISREAYLAGDDARVAREIEAVKEACGDAHLKVILETAELPTYAHVRHASELAIAAGADVIKTSTGKVDLGRDAGRRAGDARGRARPPVADRPRRRRQGRGRRLERPRRRCTCSCWSRRRSATTG